jgi:hypothetical protein
LYFWKTAVQILVRGRYFLLKSIWELDLWSFNPSASFVGASLLIMIHQWTVLDPISYLIKLSTTQWKWGEAI